MAILKKFASGFSLIELLVTISIMGILIAIVVVSYVEFNRRQIVLQSTRKIVQDLRLAQSLASNNQKPEADDCSCQTLDGYTFSIDHGTGNYTIFANCLNPIISCDPIKSETFSSDFSFSGFTSAKFKILRRGVELTGGEILTVTTFGKSQTIAVDKGGSIRIQGETP